MVRGGRPERGGEEGVAEGGERSELCASWESRDRVVAVVFQQVLP